VKFFSNTILVLALLPTINAVAADNVTDPKGELNKYLVDITGGAVSAANLIGVDKSAISQIQTSQDLVAAIQPFSSNDQKAGAAIAITPARTTITPISRETYFGSGFASRMLGALTVSYAENGEEINKVLYRKAAVSIDTSFYLSEKRDPLYIGGEGFEDCAKRKEEENQKGIDAIYGNSSLNEAARQKALEEHTKKLAEFLKPCIAKYLKEHAKWNDSRISISYGQARIKAPGSSYDTLGKYLTINTQIYTGPQSVIHLTARRVQDLLDTKTLGNANLGYSNRSLLAARLTYGDVEGTDMRGLIEVSNAKKNSNEAITDTFIYAVGIDKALFEGAWLQFRLGRNRALNSGKEQTTALFSMSIQPSLFTWKK
jgi:hypothetical protein